MTAKFLMCNHLLFSIFKIQTTSVYFVILYFKYFINKSFYSSIMYLKYFQIFYTALSTPNTITYAALSVKFIL